MVTDSPLRFVDEENDLENELFEEIWRKMYSKFSYLEESKTK